MTTPDIPATGSPSRSGFSPAACVPARGPRRLPVHAVSVDDELAWVAAMPTVALGTARRAGADALMELTVLLLAEHAAAQGESLAAALLEAEIVDAAARVVSGYLDDLPDLPLVGEPFGGEEGTD